MSRNKLVTQKFSKSKKIFVIFHWWNYDIKDWLVYFFIRYNHDSWKRRQINFSCPNSSNNMIGFFSRFSTWNTHNLYQVGITRQRTIFQQSKVLLYLTLPQHLSSTIVHIGWKTMVKKRVFWFLIIRKLQHYYTTLEWYLSKTISRNKRLLNKIYLIFEIQKPVPFLKRNIKWKAKFFLWFSYSKTMPNFKGFCQPISSSIKL